MKIRGISNLITLLINILINCDLLAQTDSCSCVANFDDLVSKTEENYIAYHQKIKGRPFFEIQYELFKKKVRDKALKIDIHSCIDLLLEYTEYFKDGHLFVYENPRYNENELKLFRANKKKYKLAENEAIDYLRRDLNRLDPIEGIWFSEDHAYKIAIIRSPKNKKQFIAVVLETTNPDWKPGFIKAFFTNNTKNYSTEYYYGSFAPEKFKSDVHKNNILNIGPTIYWGKEFPNNSRENNYVDKKNAGLPTITRIDEENILLSIPSFLLDYGYFDSLINVNKKKLTSVRNLIIDIRGNGGGNAVYFPLIELYFTKPHTEPQGLALSSPNTIRYFEISSAYQKKKPGDTTLDLYARVVKDMKEHPGKIVNGPAYTKMPIENVSISLLPQNVCILADRFNASAAESFILHSKGFSDRVITFGENTYGMIDYTSITQIKLLCNNQNYSFGYPTSTYHSMIPEWGYNATGIPPDVRIDEKVKDKIQFIINWMKKMK